MDSRQWVLLDVSGEKRIVRCTNLCFVEYLRDGLLLVGRRRIAKIEWSHLCANCVRVNFTSLKMDGDEREERKK